MRLIHTSDWHLGHTLHDHGRELEHQLFLRWLVDRIGEHDVDALLVTGDVFDTANPSALAQKQLYDFLADARARHPRLQIVILGGNHDSVARLDAPEPILRPHGVRVVGGLRRDVSGALDVEHLSIPLADRTGRTAAWLAAVPFLRRSDLPPSVSAELEAETIVDGIRAVYDAVFAACRARRSAGHALLAAGHLYVTGAMPSELSERQLFRGQQDALPRSVLPADAAYVALGHLHRAQTVGGAAHVRYSGSPIPLSMNERDYAHEVVLVELDGERLVEARSLPVPRVVPVLRIPERGSASLADALLAIAALPEATATERAHHAYLEIAIAIEEPVPGLRRILDEAVSGKAVRLLRTPVSLKTGAITTASFRARVADLSPQAVFAQMYAERYRSDAPQDLLDAFAELEAQVRIERGPT